MPFKWISDPAHETDDAVFYHGFEINGVVFSALRYCVFTDDTSEIEFFGKIHSCFRNKKTNDNEVEMQVFQHVPNNERRVDSETGYHELFVVLGDTTTVTIDNIRPQQVGMVWVPATIGDDNILNFVEQNAGKPEYPDSDDESVGSMDDFIVDDSELFGFFQYGLADDKLVYAPPPQFTDAYMTFENDENRTLQSDLSVFIVERFLNNKLADTLVSHTPSLVPALYNDKVSVQNMTVQYNGQTHQLKNAMGFRQITAFVTLLKAMLTAEALPPVEKLYEFCLRFEHGIETN